MFTDQLCPGSDYREAIACFKGALGAMNMTLSQMYKSHEDHSGWFVLCSEDTCLNFHLFNSNKPGLP